MCDFITCVTLILVWPCYMCDLVTCVTLLLVWPCYMCDFISCVTLLLVWPCYMCDVTCVILLLVWPCYMCDVTCAILLLVWPCYMCDLVTCVTLLLVWPYYLCDLVTCVTFLLVWPFLFVWLCYLCALVHLCSVPCVTLLLVWPFYLCGLVACVHFHSCHLYAVAALRSGKTAHLDISTHSHTQPTHPLLTCAAPRWYARKCTYTHVLANVCIHTHTSSSKLRCRSNRFCSFSSSTFFHAASCSLRHSLMSEAKKCCMLCTCKQRQERLVSFSV